MTSNRYILGKKLKSAAMTPELELQSATSHVGAPDSRVGIGWTCSDVETTADTLVKERMWQATLGNKASSFYFTSTL
jgi:hypothetical protein